MDYFQGDLIISLYLGAFASSGHGLAIALAETLFWGMKNQYNFGEIMWWAKFGNLKEQKCQTSFPYETLAESWCCEDGFPGEFF